MAIRVGQFRDREGLHVLVSRAVERSDRPGELDGGVLYQTIDTALTLPQYYLAVSETGGEIKGAVCGFVVPSPFGKFMTAMDLFWYAEDGSGFALFQMYLNWAQSFKQVKQVDFMNSFKFDVEDTRMDKTMKRLGFAPTGKHYMKVLP